VSTTIIPGRGTQAGTEQLVASGAAATPYFRAPEAPGPRRLK
jgi:hypothetical protein